MPREVTTGRKRGASSRAKRDHILSTAITIFGEQGYESSRWADVATEVGIGSTALYHYFESKLHCLYCIMDDALGAQVDLFERISKGSDDTTASIVAVLRAGYDLTEQEALRNRVLVSEQFLVGVPRTSPREEEARLRARAQTRDLEFAWGTFLSRAMARGDIPEADPGLMARAVLGLHNSVWHWYRPGGDLALQDVSDFYVARCAFVLGLSADRSDAESM